VRTDAEKCQREHKKKARESQGSRESARESQIPPKDFPQVFNRVFFLRFLDKRTHAKKCQREHKKKARECQG